MLRRVTESAPRAVAEWPAGWPLVAATSAGFALSVSYLYTFGVFLGPIQEAFGWSRAQITAGVTIVATCTMAIAPFAGAAIDRLGARRMALLGVVLYSVAFAALGLVGGSVWSWWLVWLAIGLSVQLVKPTVWSAAVAGRFVRSRGSALAVTLSGAGVASAVDPFLAQALIGRVGWRLAFPGLAALWLAVAMPLCLLFLRGPVVPAGGGAPNEPARSLPGLSLREALLSGRFWKLVAGVVIAGLVTLGLSLHFVPIITAQLGKGPAVASVALIGLFAMAGRLLTGWLFDRVRGPVVAAGVFCLPGVACLLLLSPASSPLTAAAAAAVIGLATGGETDVAAYLIARYFGLRHYGALFGTLVGAIGVAMAAGPLLAARSFDVFHTYTPFLELGVLPCFLAAALAASLGAYPTFVDGAGDER